VADDVQLIEVNPAKQVVWALRSGRTRAGTGQRDSVLDQPGTRRTFRCIASAGRASGMDGHPAEWNHDLSG